MALTRTFGASSCAIALVSAIRPALLILYAPKPGNRASPAGDRQTRASARELFCQGQPDAPAGAGHQGASAGQIKKVRHATSIEPFSAFTFRARRIYRFALAGCYQNLRSSEREPINLNGA